jgi:myo-inositol-1(or 4)-monophosphatase
MVELSVYPSYEKQSAKGGSCVAATQEYKIEDLTQFAVEAVRRLGDETLSYYGKGQRHLKFDAELVTEAELHLRESFQDLLTAHFPEHQVFKNNQETQEYSHEGKRYLWIYDAIDGVANFQAGIPIWGASLALIENFWPVLGVFYLPATGDLFQARAGAKALWGEIEMRVSPQKEINDESLLLTYSRFHHHYQPAFPGKIRDLGCTTAHICYVAMGRAEAALITKESYQGLAAAHLIIEAAGGKIYKLDGKEFILNEYLDGQKIEEHLLVTSPDLFWPIRECLQTAG